jgi:alkylhydroperoxidase family enzyme
LDQEVSMLKAIIKNRLDAYERNYGYDVSYVREVLDADLSAFLRFAQLTGISSYARDLPLEAQFAAKIIGTLAEDCGPCTQLMVTTAERAGVSADTLRALIRGDDGALGPDARLAVQFARAVLRRDPEADVFRDRARERWAGAGSSRSHSRSCLRVRIPR